VIASLSLAPYFNRLPRSAVAAAGYSLAAAVFLWLGTQPTTQGFSPAMAGLHFLAGLGAGCGLSMTDGVLGRTANPHKSWGIVSVFLGLCAVLFMAVVPDQIGSQGPHVLFNVFGALMVLAVLAILFAFPDPMPTLDGADTGHGSLRGIPRSAWWVILAFACMTLNQAMVFSFVERIGASRGFAPEQVTRVLIAVGLVNLLPGVLAVLLQKKWSALSVGIAGPCAQALLAVCITHASAYLGFAASTALYVFIVIFTHTFLFGLLARLDLSGRAGAATPAMMMLGSCIGPILGGAIVQAVGFAGLGWAACIVALVAVVAMTRVVR
jgi:predicted MFS family arabinose efflux permease